MKKILPVLYYLAAAVISFGGAANFFEKKNGEPANFNSSYQSGTLFGYCIGLLLCGFGLAALIRFLVKRSGKEMKYGYALTVVFVVTFFSALFFILPANVLKLWFK